MMLYSIRNKSINHKSTNFRLFICGIFLVSCMNEKPNLLIQNVHDKIILDGIAETTWHYSNKCYLHYYYGEEPKDSIDFSGSFIVLQNDSNIYFFIEIIDQIKYTHPKPRNKNDLLLWDLKHYDRVNLLFDIDNDKVLDDKDLSIGINCFMDSLFIVNDSFKDIKAVQKNTSSGYNIEMMIPKYYFRTKKVAFNIVVTDNDKKFQKKGFDVYSRWETEMGWGRNGFKEDISKRYGFLRFE